MKSRTVSRSIRTTPIGTSSKEKGDEFERIVADVFRCIAGARVQTHVKVNGKDVDIFVTVRRQFSKDLRIVVDAKDYDSVITRKRAAEEYSSYYPLITNGHADQFMLVTRRGIVANAKEVFDGNSSIHYTISELENLVVDPTQLVSNMEAQFSADGLNGYYVDTRCYNIDLQNAVKNYDLFFGEFVSFCLAKGIPTLAAGKEAWLERKGVRGSFVVGDHSEEAFTNAISFHTRKLPSRALEPIVWSWLSDQSHNLGIALLGTYGTGKSSFAKKIAFSAAVDFKAGRSNRIPLLIELREFGSHQSIEGLITHTLINKHSLSNGSFALFQKMNSSGRYFIILDGFDEMKQGMTKDALVYNFSQLNSLCVGRSKVMLCGRPTMFESEEEKAAILTGSSATDLPSKAKYIPIEIAPLEKNSILEMIASYVKVREPREEINVALKLNDIREQIQTNSELVDLLSRPVHIPMFVTILPDFSGDIAELSRGFLYETFIRKIIMREVLRLPAAYQQRYTTEQRFQFVGSLAFEMAKRGEARSIRRSEIPAAIVSPFVNQGESIETALRDLVAACFLEQKPPDILSFGHKSFLEFLTAHYLLNWTRGNLATNIPVLIYPTREIGSFVIDLCEIEDLDRCIHGSWESREFLVSCILQSVSDLWISPRYGRVGRGRTESLKGFGFGIYVSEKTKRMLSHFGSPVCIAAMSQLEMSPQLRHIICVVLYLSASELRALSAGDVADKTLAETYSEQTWEDINNIAKSDEVKQIVSRWREQVAEHSVLLRSQGRPRTRRNVDKDYHMHMSFLSSHYERAFDYHPSLNVIPGRVEHV